MEVTMRSVGEAVRGMALAFILLAALLFPGAAISAGPGESEVKAAFILNFIKFVEWPSTAFRSAGEPILLTLVGEDPLADSIEGLDGKTVSGRKVVVRRAADLASLERCHVLVVGVSERSEVAPILGAAKRWPVLTVANFEGFAGQGGTIGFIRLDDRVGFEINEESARKAGLKINPKMLYLGRSIHERKGVER